jgi:APA family basic amino acid/polyamine antiporter
VLVFRRQQPDRERPFRVPLSPFLPILGIVFCFGLMLNMARRSWIQLVIWMIIGALVYLFNHRKKLRAAA